MKLPKSLETVRDELLKDNTQLALGFDAGVQAVLESDECRILQVTLHRIINASQLSGSDTTSRLAHEAVERWQEWIRGE